MAVKFLKELKEFAIKGNVFDMAIGIIIGTAFNKIVTSVVNDLVLPPLGYLIGKVQFQNLKLVLQKEIRDSAGNVVQDLIQLNYGNFLQVVFDFTIIVFTIFIIIKVFNRLRNKAEDVQETSVPTPKNIELLTEIRDLLKEQNKKSLQLKTWRYHYDRKKNTPGIPHDNALFNYQRSGESN